MRFSILRMMVFCLYWEKSWPVRTLISPKIFCSASPVFFSGFSGALKVRA